MLIVVLFTGRSRIGYCSTYQFLYVAKRVKRLLLKIFIPTIMVDYYRYCNDRWLNVIVSQLLALLRLSIGLPIDP